MDNWTMATKLRQGTYRQGIFYHDLSLEETEQQIARIRAEARAEAMKEAALKIYELAHEFSHGEYYSRMKIITALHKLAAILADEPKDERGAAEDPAAEIAKLRAEREELRDLLWWVEAKLQPELNVSNYYHQQVCELNANATEAVLAIRAALAEKGE